MKLAVCLLTADRADYTAETVASYIECAHRPEFILLHADDGSESVDNFDIAEDAGFETIYSSSARCGPLMACLHMWNYAIQAGATHILHLENDWEFCRGLILRDDVECVRLYGAMKSKRGNRQATGIHRMGTKKLIKWHDCEPGWQRGFAHWGGPPSITAAHAMAVAITEAQTFKDISLRLNALDTLRPVDNIVWHIGEHRTPGAHFNA